MENYFCFSASNSQNSCTFLLLNGCFIDDKSGRIKLVGFAVVLGPESKYEDNKKEKRADDGNDRVRVYSKFAMKYTK